LFCADRETDEPTDMTKGIIAFCRFNNAPKHHEFVLRVIVYACIVYLSVFQGKMLVV
jgi:hypothetical protein